MLNLREEREKNVYIKELFIHAKFEKIWVTFSLLCMECG